MTNHSDLREALKDGVNSTYPSVTFERIWKLHSSRARRATRSARTWIPAGIAAIMLLTLIISPPVRASISSLIETKIIMNSSKAAVYEGWSSSRKWDVAQSYTTLKDAEKALGAKLPFPQQMLRIEIEAINRELRVTTEKGSIVGYYFTLRTPNRMLSVTANYKSETAPQFNVESTEVASTETVNLNGTQTQLIAVKEFDGYWIYMKKGDWQVVIQGLAQSVSVNNDPASRLTKKEILDIARSINW